MPVSHGMQYAGMYGQMPQQMMQYMPQQMMQQQTHPSHQQVWIVACTLRIFAFWITTAIFCDLMATIIVESANVLLKTLFPPIFI